MLEISGNSNTKDRKKEKKHDKLNKKKGETNKERNSGKKIVYNKNKSWPSRAVEQNQRHIHRESLSWNRLVSNCFVQSELPTE